MLAIPAVEERRRVTPVAAFLVALVVYGAVAGDRLRVQSADPHFVLQASAWLHGRLGLDRWPDGADDAAIVEHVALDDGTVVRGRRLHLRSAFHVAGGGDVPVSRVRQSIGRDYQIAFPPFPAAVFLPLVLLFGPGTNDVIVTALLAALAPALLLLAIGRLRERGHLQRTRRDDVWLAALLAFGTVLFFSSVQGRVWYTAHVIAVDLCLLYVLASIDAGRPLLAGTCLALAFLTRAPTLFMFPLFAEEMWRTGQARMWRRWAGFAAPVAAAGLLTAWHNHARFGEATEFGYSYLVVRQQFDIERYGLFHPHYLARNLVAAFALFPELSAQPPYLRISGHGLAMWITTPAFLLLASARPRRPLQIGLLVSAVSVGVWTLLYQNTGWFQFGYRFSLDYIVFLVLLLATADQPFTRVTRAVIVTAVAVNLFGAVTFNRYHEFYRADLAAYRALVHE